MTILTPSERVAISSLLISPRYFTIAEKLRGARLHNHATTESAHKLVRSAYRKLGVDSRFELLAMRDELNLAEVLKGGKR